MPSPESFTAPSVDRFVAACRGVSNITDRHVQMLRVHYHATERTVTAKELADLVGYTSYSVVNAQYGRLARLVGERLDYNPETERLGTLVRFKKRHNVWNWLMRPEVAEALERLGWVEDAAFLLPEEIAATTAPLTEGAVSRVSVNAYERNPEARRRCIKAHGIECCICGFNFGVVYGEVAEGYIHVHHLRPLSGIEGEYHVDPVADLRPVCPNCHAVIHWRIPAFTIEEARALLKQ